MTTRTLSAPERPPLATGGQVRRVLVRRWRMAMPGDSYAYEVVVDARDARPEARANTNHTTILPEFGWNACFLSYANATATDEHFAMPLGIERLRHWNAHDVDATREAHRIACQVFRELAELDTLPLLWVDYGRTLPDVEDAWVTLPEPEETAQLRFSHTHAYLTPGGLR